MEVNLNSSVTLTEAAEIVVAIGTTNTCYLVGEPGIGKTAMHDTVVAMTGHKGVYIDAPNTELGDVGIPVPNHDTKTTHFYLNDHWGLHTGEPLVIFIDEFTKASQAVQNMLHPLIHERRIGGVKLHEDSIVMIAGNLTTDGVGDTIKAHTIGRITKVRIRKPHAGIKVTVHAGRHGGTHKVLQTVRHICTQEPSVGVCQIVVNGIAFRD